MEGFAQKHAGFKRQFIQLSRAWYGEANLRGAGIKDEINIGFYDGEGTTGEFCIEWIDLGRNIAPLLRAFDDSWSALWEFRDVLEKLAALDNTNPTPADICKLLLSCGVEDRTPE